MKTYKVLIVDDESLARDTVRLLLQDRPEFEIIGECEDGTEAVGAIRNLKPDLLFLDIQMPEMTGFEVLEELSADGQTTLPATIFATAYDTYAVKAFEVHAIDYLLKPFDDDRFEQALSRAVDRIETKKATDVNQQIRSLLQDINPKTPAPLVEQPSDTPSSAKGWVERIPVKHRGAMIFVPTANVDWVEAAGDYVMIYTGPKSYLLRETMQGIIEKLDPSRFARIHRSTIVNIERIKEIHPHFNGAWIATLQTGKQLKISRRYWAEVEKTLAR